MDFGIASVAAITVIAYLVGAACKASQGFTSCRTFRQRTRSTPSQSV